MMSKALIFSRGILKIPNLKNFLPEYQLINAKWFQPTENVSAVLGWGLRPSSRRARIYASSHHLPYFALEDGFLRSLGLGVAGYPPFSMVVDDCGIYYDSTKPSRLEKLILSAENIPQSILSDAEKALSLLVKYNLSKYNHAPDFSPDMSNKSDIVLVVDQTFGDMAVQYGQATEYHFKKMLDCAIEENPNAEIWVRTHPDVLSGRKKGYLTNLSNYTNKIRLFVDDVNALSLLKYVDKVYCVTSQMGFEALMLRKKVVTFGVPWFAGWGLSDDRHPMVTQLVNGNRRVPRTLLQLFTAAYLQYSRYINPNNGEVGSIFDVIEYLHRTKLLNLRLSGHLYSVGMSLWKRAVIKPFFNLPQCHLKFVSSLKKLEKLPHFSDTKLLIWSQGNAEILNYAKQHNLPLLRMEDGFIRSVGLGSNLVAPLSLVIDDLGIYFNAQTPSRLESILQNYDFSEQDLILAEKLRQRLVAENIGKYNVGNSGFSLKHQDRLTILVPGQVEDDASIRFGSPQINKNLDLLKQVRTMNPDAYIIYKPHPDVESGNRAGKIARDKAMSYADDIVENINILDCINQVDEVHTMTSLAGFEALLRGKVVHCYGLPFYSNWGLTKDYICLTRRQRKLSLLQLIAAVMIYYPQYVDPKKGCIIDAEHAINILREQKFQSQNNGLHRYWIAKQLEKLKQLYQALKY